MHSSTFTPEDLSELRTLAAQWGKIVSRKAFGEAGPGVDVDFRTMEQIASAAAKGLTEGTLQLLLEQQHQKLPVEQSCPTCGRVCPTQTSKRSLTVQGAEIEQTEPIAHCPACRRDFFPPTDRAWLG